LGCRAVERADAVQQRLRLCAPRSEYLVGGVSPFSVSGRHRKVGAAYPMRIPTKPATFSDLKAAICSDVKPDAVPRRSRPKIPIGMSDAGAAPAGRWG